MNGADSQVFIVGAGPTGLVLAFWLTRLGVRVRLVDKAPEPGQTSRAIAVAARTLEFYRQARLAGAVVERGVPMAAMNLWIKGRHEARLEFGTAGQALTPFPFVLSFAQDVHERLLIERLGDIGVRVERPLEVTGFEEKRDGVEVRLRRPDGSTEACRADYIAGCDGARSEVRGSLGTGFPGGTYEHLFYVADVEASGPQMNQEGNISMSDDGDFVVCLALDRGTHARVIGTVRSEAEAKGDRLTFDDVNARIIDQMGLRIERVNWFSTYRVHHRVAASFRRGRAFLLGDAGHIHSPVGGQGMNTGIGDAVNLAWKLAAVLRSGTGAAILDSYEEERIPFARRLVATTDRAFEIGTTTNPLGKQVRLRVVPRVLSALSRSESARRFLFRTVSQISVSYPRSRLSEGRAGSVRGGDRLPWVSLAAGGDNFVCLDSMSWQVHVYGAAPSDVRAVCSQRRVALHELPWGASASRAGLAEDAVYLVRPDGYVALATEGASAGERLGAYFDQQSLR
jgi:2-polyprenyl-6-methoxyphenol hydroxylase-like FAD-dependent oxidoreductase